MLILGIAIFTSILSVPLYLFLGPQFGGKVTDEVIKGCARSKYYRSGIFRNPEPTAVNFKFTSLPGFIKTHMATRKKRKPRQPIPVEVNDLRTMRWEDNVPRFAWFGHSTLLLELNNMNFLVDPMFGEDVTPISPTKNKRFSKRTIDIIDQLPPVEAVFITHDHYDHLDFVSITQLMDKVSKYFVPLGVGRHLESWGISPEKIKEMDWWEEAEVNGVKVVFTPARHYGGRGISDRYTSFWGGWIFEGSNQKVYISGDTGFTHFFREIGEKYGPFDWVFIECGQYHELWKQIHLHPEECVRAVLEVGGKCAVPIHWGAFALAQHPWKEPVERFVKESQRCGLSFATPRLGEVVRMDQEPPTEKWYERIK